MKRQMSWVLLAGGTALAASIASAMPAAAATSGSETFSGTVAAGMPVAASAGSGQHAAITITANSDFTAPGAVAGCACVTAGNGTPGSPYVIGPWAITAPSGGSS